MEIYRWKKNTFIYKLFVFLEDFCKLLTFSMLCFKFHLKIFNSFCKFLLQLLGLIRKTTIHDKHKLVRKFLYLNNFLSVNCRFNCTSVVY